MHNYSSLGNITQSIQSTYKSICYKVDKKIQPQLKKAVQCCCLTIFVQNHQKFWANSVGDKSWGVQKTESQLGLGNLYRNELFKILNVPRRLLQKTN